MKARAAALLALAALLLPGCIAMFGVEEEGLPKRIARLEKRIQELERSRNGGPPVLEAPVK